MKRVLMAMLLVVSFTATSVAQQTTYDGYAAHYRDGLMEQVAANRGMPVVDCMIATPYADLGTWVTVESLLTGVVQACRVTDIPHPHDRQSIIERGIVVEFGFANIDEMCNLSYAGQEPPRACPVRLVIGTPEISVARRTPHFYATRIDLY